MKIQVAIADDYKIYRDGLKLGLSADKHIDVILEAGNGEDLLKQMALSVPDVVIMDLKMPLMDGMQATIEIKNLYKAVKVIAVTMYDDEQFITHLMEIGANGYLLKNADIEEIRKAIYTVHQEDYYFNEMVNRALLKKMVSKGKGKPSLHNQVIFTERELDVLRLICHEKTAAEIGKEIFLSTRSVEGIRLRMIDKAGVRTITGLVLFAVRNGMV